jgi:hypothetical protein
MTRLLAVLLLTGSLVLLVSAILHPILPLTAAGDLSLIHHTGHWHVIHLGLLYGTGLIIPGIWARWYSADGSERPGLAVAFAVLAIGEALNGVNIAYMTGPGTLLAQMASEGIDVATVYQATHLFAVTCGRLAGFLLAIAAGLVAMSTRSSAGEPRWLVGLATLACVAGLIGNLFATPGHPLMLTSVGVMAVWQVGTAMRLLRRPSSRA